MGRHSLAQGVSPEDVGVERMSQLCGDYVGAFLGAEDAMNQVCAVGVRHKCRPSGTPVPLISLASANALG
jgi:hypothetical protein